METSLVQADGGDEGLWGLAGLLGLAGQAGLERRKDTDTRHPPLISFR